MYRISNGTEHYLECYWSSVHCRSSSHNGYEADRCKSVNNYRICSDISRDTAEWFCFKCAVHHIWCHSRSVLADTSNYLLHVHVIKEP